MPSFRIRMSGLFVGPALYPIELRRRTAVRIERTTPGASILPYRVNTHSIGHYPTERERPAAKGESRTISKGEER